MSKGLTMNVEWTTRLCTVGEGKMKRTGYFHCWEHYSNPLIGGATTAFTRVYGIVEFSDGVKRLDPTDIHFCDEENEMLRCFDDGEEKE